MNNYINIDANSLDSHVYRVMPINRFYELFSKKENVLVKPSMWDDPFENFVMKSSFRLPDNTVADFAFSGDSYGQCWTLQKSSDAIWRIYSPDKTSVRVRTTIRKLLESLQSTLGKWASVEAFIGKVRYLKDGELIDFGNTVFSEGLNASAFAETLLIKRRAFVHEKEVRLLYFAKSDIKKDLFSYKIEPHELIDQVMIDPRLDLLSVQSTKKQIRDVTGFKGRIKRSLLYAPPREFIFPIQGI